MTPHDDLARQHRELNETWRVPRGVLGWFMVVDHRTIGARYVVTAFIFFILAGVLAALMRLQLALPDNRVIGPDLYNQLTKTHGLAMMFLFAVPVMEAMGVYLVPLMVGTRNIAFPRLNAFSYYMFVFGGIMLFTALLVNAGPDVGWRTVSIRRNTIASGGSPTRPCQVPITGWGNGRTSSTSSSPSPSLRLSRSRSSLSPRFSNFERRG